MMDTFLVLAAETTATTSAPTMAPSTSAPTSAPTSMTSNTPTSNTPTFAPSKASNNPSTMAPTTMTSMTPTMMTSTHPSSLTTVTDTSNSMYRDCSYGKKKNGKGFVKQNYPHRKPRKYEDCPPVLAYDPSCVPVTTSDWSPSITSGMLKIALSDGTAFKVEHKKVGVYDNLSRHGDFLMDACKFNKRIMDVFVSNYNGGANIAAIKRRKSGKVLDSYDSKYLTGEGNKSCGGQEFHLAEHDSLLCITGVSEV